MTASYVYVGPKPWTPSDDQLAAFAGRYRSDEVGATWTLAIERGKLVASVRSSVRVELTPAYADAFVAGGPLGFVWFTRDARGAVTEMHSGAARVWDFTFAKVRTP